MAETDPRVMSLVEAALKQNPSVSVQELYNLARKKKRSISSMSLRQFHARYPLQIKRRAGSGFRRRRKPAARMARGSSGRASTPRRQQSGDGGVDRDAVRSALLGFAADLAAADSRSDAVAVVASVDRYVDQIVGAAR